MKEKGVISMKKLLSLMLALLMVLALVGCGNKPAPEPTPADDTPTEGAVLNLWTWNEEFWGFLEKYYADEKIDLFLAEADYIIKYTRSDATLDVKSIGVTDFSNTYPYTVDAASDEKGT
ncbi:MAG: hypothetical protein IIZ47_00355, partial [Erysipelotrichaceae bacterium]|nr:hypothetical protein [Erysipelotrichaceae bacterium]